MAAPRIDDERFAGERAVVRARREALASGWQADLALVRAAAQLSDEAMRAESAALAVALYGEARASWYSPEPGAISLLTRGSARSEDETRFAAALDSLAATIGGYKKALVERLITARTAGDMATVRSLGVQVNGLHAAGLDVKQLDELVRSRLTVAGRRLDEYRAKCLVRPPRSIDADDALCLRAVPPDRSGYEQVLDFYRLTDASRYSFGRAPGGPQHFTDVRRNVAILRADGCARARTAADDGRADELELFEAYAVSGASAPGLNVSASELGSGVLQPSRCADGLGEVYLRQHDAEFKLLLALCVRALGVRAQHGRSLEGDEPAAASGEGAARDAAGPERPGPERAAGAEPGPSEYCGTITLWSKKPLCDSCAAVWFAQIPRLLPRASLRLIVDDEEAAPGPEGAGGRPPRAACSCSESRRRADEGLGASEICACVLERGPDDAARSCALRVATTVEPEQCTAEPEPEQATVGEPSKRQRTSQEPSD